MVGIGYQDFPAENEPRRQHIDVPSKAPPICSGKLNRSNLQPRRVAFSLLRKLKHGRATSNTST